MDRVWLCGNCRSLNQAHARECYRCRAKRDTAEVAPEGSREGAPGLAATAPRDPSLFGAVVFGVAAALVATGAWYWFDTSTSGRRAVAFAWVVGLAIGIATRLGGRHRSSTPIVLFSVLLTIGAIVVGEYLLISHYLALAAGQETDAIVLADPGLVINELGAMLETAPLRPVLWAFAVVAAFIVPWRALVGSSATKRD